MPRQRWSDLSERTRRLLITAAVADGTLRVAARRTSAAAALSRLCSRA